MVGYLFICIFYLFVYYCFFIIFYLFIYFYFLFWLFDKTMISGKTRCWTSPWDGAGIWIRGGGTIGVIYRPTCRFWFSILSHDEIHWKRMLCATRFLDKSCHTLCDVRCPVGLFVCMYVCLLSVCPWTTPSPLLPPPPKWDFGAAQAILSNFVFLEKKNFFSPSKTPFSLLLFFFFCISGYFIPFLTLKNHFYPNFFCTSSLFWFSPSCAHGWSKAWHNSTPKYSK